jgi:hypothetical protein
MLVNADRRRALAIAALLLTVVVVGVASAQEANMTEDDLADKEDGGSVVLLLGLVCGLPFFLLALFGILWAVAYPVMLVWAVLFSGKKLDRQIANTTSREVSLRDSLGRDPLTTIDDPGPHNPTRGDVSAIAAVNGRERVSTERIS